MSILRAIVAGERDPIKLAQMKHPQIKSSTQEIAKALEGDYCQEHLLPCRQRWNFTTAISSKSWSAIDVSKRPLLLLKQK
jgi:hypothetical protein